MEIRSITLYNLSGLCVYPNISDISNFTWDVTTEWEWRDAHYILKNGRVLPMPGEKFHKIIFDFDGRDFDWNGYVSGFIYPDGKFLGKWHYVQEAQIKVQPLNGTYEFFDDRIDLKGTWFIDDNKKYGFFIRLEFPSKNVVEREPTPEKIRPLRVKNINRTDTLSDVLNLSLLENVIDKSIKIKETKSPSAFNHYKHVTGLKLNPQKLNDVILAMAIAYSWMPTMLDIYLPKKKSSLIDAVNGLGSITTIKAFDTNVDNIERWLSLMVDTVNHSIVGASKTLHILFPKNLPILDRRVLKSWDKIFKKHFRQHPTFKLPKNVPQNRKSMIKTYMSYWRILLCWNYNINNKDVRKLEEPFYILGK